MAGSPPASPGNIAYVPRIGWQGQKGPGLPVDMGNDATCGIQDDAIGHVGQDGGQERKLAAVFFIEGNEFQGVLVYGQDGRFAGPDGINRHGAVPGNLGQQSAADDGRIGRHREALHHFQQFVIRRLDPVGRMDDEALAYIRRAGVDIEDEMLVQEQMDFLAVDVPESIQDIICRAVQAENGDFVDGIGQYLIGPAVGDDDPGSFADHGAGLVQQTGEIDDFNFDGDVMRIEAFLIGPQGLFYHAFLHGIGD